MNDLYFNINLPFYTGIKAGTTASFSGTECNQGEDLINLPFSLYLDKEYLIPRLYITEKIQTAIDASYENGSMLSTPLGTSSLSNNRLNEFLNCLKTKVSGGFVNKKFIEIGSGTGHLLFEVKRLGADVTGFEVGPQAQKYSKEFDINVINDYFRPSHLKQKVDCVFSSGCLEHIIELNSFMKDS
ncbi:MAG: class I SAM-dependent methyltransferase, partial [Gammaproteobacteria bacterium]